MSLPKRINAMKVLSFDVGEVIDGISSLGYEDEITLEVILDYIEDHTSDEWEYAGLILQDENGEEL